MIPHLEVLWTKFRRHISSSEWIVRLLRLSRSTASASEPGLVIIQIDGLSRRILEKAISRGKLPFLKSLCKKQQYELHTHYSGLPSSTPAVQGELFYGIKTIVPGFSFYDSIKGREFRMYEPEDVREIEKQLEASGSPLLTGGSSYSNIFSGGAEEVHFCSSRMKFSTLREHFNPTTLLLLLNIFNIMRIAALFAVELVLAIYDSLRGIIHGKHLVEEIKFIFPRLGVSILLREFITANVKMDVARGLPIIYLNFLGYDEQAHRRGPASRLALWSLKGIDSAIKRIYNAAERSSTRDYDVWILSDHGQVPTVPYPKANGSTIQRAVSEIFNEEYPYDENFAEKFGIRGIRFRAAFSHVVGKSSSFFVVSSMGPIGHIYPRSALSPEEREHLGQSLAVSAHIPVVLSANPEGTVDAWTDEGKFQLPRDAGKILGPVYPFKDTVTKDLVKLCHHPRAGTFIICGWRYGKRAVSFPFENGSHAGFAPDEILGFGLFPDDAPLSEAQKGHVRPIDIREGALHFLGRKEFPETHLPRISDVHRATSRVMTYNVHSCIGMDGKVSPHRIARVIARHDPDVVCLQELDYGKSRTLGHDQAERIAQYLRMDHHFHPVVRMEEEQFGDAVLSRRPMSLIKTGRLPGISGQEPRGALWVEVDFNGTRVQVINTHFGILPNDGLKQAVALVDEEWLGNPGCRAPVVLCGDFNAMPSSPVYRKIQNVLQDVQKTLEGHKPRKTWFGRFPVTRIDHIFSDDTLEVENIEVPRTDLLRVASDHLPLIVDFRVKKTV